MSRFPTILATMCSICRIVSRSPEEVPGGCAAPPHSFMLPLEVLCGQLQGQEPLVSVHRSGLHERRNP